MCVFMSVYMCIYIYTEFNLIVYMKVLRSNLCVCQYSYICDILWEKMYTVAVKVKIC